MTKKLNFRMHNDLQASHVISIFAVFKKLSEKRSYKMMHFVFKSLKLLTLEFQFWKILECKCIFSADGETAPIPPVDCPQPLNN